MNKRGFTIFELLVVVGIIALLAAAIMASTTGARARARDERRIAELGQIQLALQAFYEVNGRFPTENDPDDASGNDPSWNGAGAQGHICAECEGGISDILREYSGRNFSDPLDAGDVNGYNDGGDGYFYYYDGWHTCNNGEPQVAVLIAQLENPPEEREWDICDNEGSEGNGDDLDAYYIVLGQGTFDL